MVLLSVLEKNQQSPHAWKPYLLLHSDQQPRNPNYERSPLICLGSFVVQLLVLTKSLHCFFLKFYILMSPHLLNKHPVLKDIRHDKRRQTSV